MAPKKAAAPKAKASASATPQHASYQDMVKEAIVNLKERNGSSRQAIKKYIQANNNLGTTSDAAFANHLSKALKSGEENGVFERPKGASGPVKLKKPAAKDATAAPAKAAKPKAEKTEKKAAAPKKTAAAKKAAPKKAAAAAKPAAKKAAAKPKANASKPRAKKTPTAAPAVESKPPVVLGKTKSGRVTKSTAPQATKSAAKKAAPKKKATPKKA